MTPSHIESKCMICQKRTKMVCETCRETAGIDLHFCTVPTGFVFFNIPILGFQYNLISKYLFHIHTLSNLLLRATYSLSAKGYIYIIVYICIYIINTACMYVHNDYWLYTSNNCYARHANIFKLKFLFQIKHYILCDITTEFV